MDIKVLQVLPELESGGGVERGVIEIASFLNNEGIDVLVASNGGKLVEKLKDENITHFKLPLNSKNPFKILLNALRLKKIILENDINIVHARSRAPAWSAYLSCLLTKAKFVTTFHGTYDTSNPLKRFYNSIMLRGSKVIAVSNYIKKHIETRYHYISDDIVVIPRCADLEYFNKGKVSAKRVQALLKELDFTQAKDSKIVLMPARFSRHKGHEYFINALNLIKKENFQAIIIGKCSINHLSYKGEIQAAIDKHKLTDKVKILEATSDMPALYSIADAVVVPSQLPEPFGRVTTESFAMEVPVIATRVGASPEIIENNVDGFLTSVNDCSELAEKLKYLFHLKPTERSKITAAALKKVKDQFSLEKMCQSTVEVYKSILLSN
jgi:glycosyltransferase involved in cell wall biosynthesis